MKLKFLGLLIIPLLVLTGCQGSTPTGEDYVEYLAESITTTNENFFADVDEVITTVMPDFDIEDLGDNMADVIDDVTKSLEPEKAEALFNEYKEYIDTNVDKLNDQEIIGELTKAKDSLQELGEDFADGVKETFNQAIENL